MIRYVYTCEGIRPEQLQGFFEGWPETPSSKIHLQLLAHSDKVVLAVDEDSDAVVGFVTAISDHVLSAYIPFLEVLPEYRGRGIGTELMRRMLDQLGNLYMVDLLCDPELKPFYASLGMHPATGMMIRNREHQSGQATPRAHHACNRKEQ